MPSFSYPPPPNSSPPTPDAEVNAALVRLAGQRAAWAAVGPADRAAMLERMIDKLLAVAPRWVAAAATAKGTGPDDPVLVGEEWIAGPTVVGRNLRQLAESLREVADHGAPTIARRRLSYRADGRLVVQVVPDSLYEQLLFTGFTAEVWMQPGVTADNLSANMARIYRTTVPPRVCAVLGAGNVGSIGIMDAVYKLFVENELVALKMNPVNAYLGPFYAEIAAELIERGVLAITYGGAKEGAYLVTHPLVETLHITGSDATHDAIVWGPAEGRAERKAAGAPVNTREISSELGNVTPIIVVPGPWSDADLTSVAANLATMVVNNGSFNCVAGKLLVVPRDWPLRGKLLDAVRAALRAVPARRAYYPGADQRYRMFVDSHPNAEVLGAAPEGALPWTLIPNLDPNNADDLCFRQEPFCGVLHEVALPGADALTFLPAAVKFCNETVWGTLGCSVLIHPATRRDPASEAAFQEALDDLRYGSIVVNHWVALIYGLCNTTWGAYPGHPLDDIQSGRGVVHNTLLFDRPQKSVAYGPLRPFPKPYWFADHKRAAQLGPRLASFQSRISPFKIPGLLVPAVLG
jgi:acyl-CoA reductase-like NAD-dependent aldehyde dehydrogenase